MRQRWASKRTSAEIEPSAAVDGADEEDTSIAPSVSALDLFAAGVIQSHLPAADTISDANSPVLGFEQLEATNLLGSKPKIRAVKPKVLLHDAVEAESSPSTGGSSLPVFNSRTFDNDRMRCTDKKQFRYPWERGPLKHVFGNSPLVANPKLSVQPSPVNLLRVAVSIGTNAKATATIETESFQPVKAVFLSVVHSSTDIDHKTEKAKKRVAAVEQWWDLISISLEASTVGRKVIDEADVDSYEAYGRELLDACFGLKSPDTLKKRFLSLKSFSDWCEVNVGQHWIPLRESHAWQYIRYLKATGAPATKASTFMEAVRFCWFIVGVDGGDEIMSSLRAKGLSSQLFVTKRPWRPADLLTVNEVIRLHNFLEDSGQNLVDRIVTGHLLHLLYVRARWSDLFAVRNGMVDRHQVFFELETQVHKSAKGADSKSKLLPLVCPCRGINGKDWVACYLKLREDAGLDLPGMSDRCMLPAPSGVESEPWTSRTLTSEEGARFLRKVLGAPKTPERRLSTHSMKSTCISWTSKYGMGFEARALLARHSSSVSNPTAIYSRDLLSPVLRAFVTMLAHIYDGQFSPDETRSGMLTPKPSGMSAPCTPSMHLPTVMVSESHLPTDTIPADVVSVKSSDAGDVDSNGIVECEDKPSDAGGVDACEGALASEVDSCVEDDLSMTSESAADDSSSSSEDGRIIDIYRHYGGSEPAQSDLYINNTSFVLHCVGAAGRFKCGRIITKTYSRVMEFGGIRCTRCFDV